MAEDLQLFQIVMTGDPVEWVPRPGQPEPVVKPALGVIQLEAPDKKSAEQLARFSHPEYHTVESVKQLKRR